MVPCSPLGSIPPGHGSAAGEKEAHRTYPPAGANIGVLNGIK